MVSTAASTALPGSCRARAGVQVPLAHRLAPRDRWDWLPQQDRGVLMVHPWCERCGAVRATGADAAFDLGGLLNLLARLERRLAASGRKVTEAQRRLVVSRITRGGVDDKFGLTRPRQIHLLAEIVGSYVGLPAEAVHAYLHEC